MPFPFLFLALSLALGILFSSLLSFSLLSLVLSMIACLACAWLLYPLQKHKLSFLFVLFTTFLFGASLYTFSSRSFEENSLRKLKQTTYTDFYGTLYKSPSFGIAKDYLFLKVKKVVYQNKEEKINGNLRITVPRSSEFPAPLSLYARDKVKVSARLLPYKSFQNFKTFSLDAYLKSQKIHNRASAKSPLLVEKIESGKKYSPIRLISVIRQKIQKKIKKHFSSPDTNSLSPQGAVLEALLLGERKRMDFSVTQSLQKAGIYHLFAISGAHIAIISFFLFSLFNLMRIPNRFSYLLVMAFLLFYVFLVEGRPSVLRATIMTLAFLFGKLIWRNVNLINTISISAFILLLFNPFSLFSVGFQLTFAATFSIILFFPKIIKLLPRLPLRISEIMAISLTAQLGVLPFIASSFNRVTFSSLILNFAALPLVALIMACGYIFIPLSFVSSFLAQLLAKVLNYLIDLLIGCSHIFDSLTFISYRIPTPHLLTIIGYFLFLYLLLLPLKIKRQKLILLLCFLVFFAVLISYPFSSKSKNLKLTFIDVGQGESILVEFPGKRKMLIDGGGFPEGTFDIGENVVSPFLWKKGLKKIDYLVLTHAHPDHLDGLKAVSKNFKIGEYWEAYSPTEAETYTEFKSQLGSYTLIKRLFRGDSYQQKKVIIEVLHPESGKTYVPTVHNDHSLVLRLLYGQTSILLPGDIEIDAENKILENSREIKSQILKSPHHGSRTSSSKAFLDRVAPQIVVISIGLRNRYGFPDHEVLERYKKMGIKVYRTDHHGAVEVSSDGQKIYVRTASGIAE
ncbi:MAG: DNA internalization-related competence protein ComEC/Rec2 [Candidatus Aminicenantes bacterium]|nr:DNA internalization-related competence protein ComEC/Rec2 [Candidatus Aminicenantes bacterium]